MADSLPTPITREDRYLACLCGTYSGDLPAPITREERYLALLCSAYSSDLPNPITRADRYLACLCGVYDGDLPNPITRKDCYLATLCGTYDGDLPSPITREDYYLSQLAADGGVLYEDKTAIGVTVEVTDAAAQPLNSLTLYGWSTQDGTPTPDNPVDIVSAADSGEVAVTVADGDGNSQTLILAATNGLPGIPVSSNGNYTDENGQMWVADEIALNRDGSGTYVQRIATYTTNSATSASVIGNTRQTDSDYFGIQLSIGNIQNIENMAMLCDKLVYVGIGKSITGNQFTYVLTNGIVVYGLAKNLVEEETADAVKAYIVENPLTFNYLAKNATKTTLTADEIAAFLALKTYSGTTIITNDADAYMEVGYKAKKE